MTVFARLQDFQAPAPEEIETPARTEDLPGYAAGFEDGRAAANAAAAEATAALSRSLDDLKFGFAEAQTATLHALGPFFVALRDALLPKTIPQTFRAELIDLLTTAVQVDLDRPITLRVSPDTAAQLDQSVAGDLANRFQSTIDTRLKQHEVIVENSRSSTSLNVDDLARRLADILDGLIAGDTPPSRIEPEGQANVGE